MKRPTATATRPLLQPILALVTSLSLAAPSLAQSPEEQTFMLRGVVIDEVTRQPVPAALVSVLGSGQAAITGFDGVFAFPEFPSSEPITVRITAPEHVGVVQEIESIPSGTTEVEILVVPIDAVLRGLIVGVEAAEAAPESASLTAADLVARQAPGSVGLPTQVGAPNRAVRLRGTNSLTQDLTPILFIDGVRVAGNGSIIDVLEQIPADMVERVEVLRGTEATLAHPYAANGVIRVYTVEGSR